MGNLCSTPPAASGTARNVEGRPASAPDSADPPGASGSAHGAEGQAVSASGGADGGGVTFRVNDVSQPTALCPSTSAAARMGELACAGLEMEASVRLLHHLREKRASAGPSTSLDIGLVAPDATSSHQHQLLAGVAQNGFIAAVTKAFAEHYPLALRPEHIWTLILQGVAAHVNQHAEELRSKFVSHEGKKELTVRRDEFCLGATGDDWRGVVAEFSEQIAENTVASAADLMATGFSSTTPDERVAGQMAVMNIVEQYFDFKMSTACGFPSITLEGSLQDWRSLRRKAEILVQGTCTEEFSTWWLKALLPVLEKFVAQYEDPTNTDVTFWQSMAKQGGVGGSGGYTWLNGWYNVFFPQLKSGGRNSFCEPYSPGNGYAREDPSKPNHYTPKWCGGDEPEGVRGPDGDDIPTGILSAPVTWNYLGRLIPLQFRAGFVGAEQRDDGTIAPAIGWLIRYAPQVAPGAA